jgi:hypothetical protein
MFPPCACRATPSQSHPAPPQAKSPPAHRTATPSPQQHPILCHARASSSPAHALFQDGQCQNNPLRQRSVKKSPGHMPGLQGVLPEVPRDWESLGHPIVPPNARRAIGKCKDPVLGCGSNAAAAQRKRRTATALNSPNQTDRKTRPEHRAGPRASGGNWMGRTLAASIVATSLLTLL